MRTVKKTLTYRMVLVAALLVLMTIAVMPGTAQEEGVRLRAGQVGDLTSLEPYRASANNYIFIEQVFDQLLVNVENRGLEAEGAVEWAMAEDNTSVTFTLREGMMTHDGSPIDAEMLATQFQDRILNVDRGVALYQQFLPWVESVEVVDPMTVRINFNGPTPHAPDLLAITPIADPDMFIRDDGTEALGNEEDKQIGSGPFRLVEYVPGSHITFDAFEDYWTEGSPAIAGIDVRIFGDAASMIAALEAGELDYVFNPPFEDAARLQNNPEFTVHVPQTQGVLYVLMVNPEREQLNDVRVRQAINHAINRDAINAGVLAGLAIPTSVCFPPSSPAYSADQEVGSAGNMERAQELMAEAGNPTVNVGITVPGNNLAYTTMAEIIAANLQEAGINATVNAVEQNIYTQSRTSQDFDILISQIAGTNTHPAGMTNSFVFAPVDNRFFDDIEPQQEFLDFQDAFNSAMAATTEEDAAAAWQAASTAITNGAWVDCLAAAPFLHITRANVQGFTWTESDKPIFANVTIGE